MVKLSRRQFIQSSLYGLGAMSTLGLEGCGIAGNQPDPPNILLIVTDDQRWDAMGCAGKNAIIHTPNMDSLAARGTRFTNAFVTSPISCASRTSILTGLYERTHGHNFGTPLLAREHIEMSYPALLRKAGYYTGFVGKLGVFTDPDANDIDRMFDIFRPLESNPYFKKRGEQDVHLTDITTDETIAFLEKRDKNRPFCLSVSFNAPHAEDTDPRQYIWPHATEHLYRDSQIPPPGDLVADIYAAAPRFLQESLARKRYHWRFDTPTKYQEMVKGYYRMITGIDNGLGRIIGALESLQLAKNTVVIFMSDNGYFLGERGFAGKWLMYEPSVRIPLLIMDPRSPVPARGQIAEDMVLNVDIAPTLLDYAGIAVPELMQGTSLWALLHRSATDWRREVFAEHLYNHPEIPKSEMVRTRDWKYIRYPEFAGYEELYNLSTDPMEATNRAMEKGCESHLIALRQRCNSFIEQLKLS
ncbi:MAG: sulfatase [Proteobacteria bacterium]|nr:sulfatase [Pseudomonadota bacterium]